MYQNPYAPPQPQDPYRTSAPVRGEPQPWDPSDVLRIGFELFKQNWGALTGAVFIMLFLGMMPGQVPGVLTQAGVIDPQMSLYISLPFATIGWLVQMFFAAGLVRVMLDVGRTGTSSFSQVFSAGGNGRFLAFLGLQFLKTLAIGFGVLFFIVPGIILALGLSMSSYYVIDQGMGPIDAMKASWETTTGHKGNIFVFVLLSGLIGIVGMLACCLGYFPAVAVAQLAEAVIYLRLSGTAAGPSVFGASPIGPWGPGGPGGPPGPGGFGPPPGGPGGYGGPPPGGFGPPPGFGGPPGGGGYGPPGGGGYGPPGGGGGYGPPPGF